MLFKQARISVPDGFEVAGANEPSRGERSRSQLHFKLGGAENRSILAVNALAVNVLAVNSVLRVLPTPSSGFVHF